MNSHLKKNPHRLDINSINSFDIIKVKKKKAVIAINFYVTVHPESVHRASLLPHFVMSPKKSTHNSP